VVESDREIARESKGEPCLRARDRCFTSSDLRREPCYATHAGESSRQAGGRVKGSRRVKGRGGEEDGPSVSSAGRERDSCARSPARPPRRRPRREIDRRRDRATRDAAITRQPGCAFRSARLSVAHRRDVDRTRRARIRSARLSRWRLEG